MTALDPSHLPWLADDQDTLTGAAVRTTIPRAFPKSRIVDLDGVDDDSLDGRRGWQKKKAQRRSGRKSQRMPIPPIPDQRFEQGFLLSLLPFISPRGSKATSNDKETAQKLKATETVALVKTPRQDLLTGAVDIEWASVFWVIFRDQLFSPLVQGALWASLALGYRATVLRWRKS